MDRTRNTYEDLLSIPDLEDFGEHVAYDFSWILDMVKGKEEEAPELQLKKSDPQGEDFGKLGNSDFNPFYNMLDNAPPTSSADMGTEKDKDVSTAALIDLLPEPSNSMEVPSAQETSESSFDLYSDNRWSSFATNSSHLWPSQTVSCYSPLSTQVFGNIFFFIDGGKIGWTPSPAMKITVVDYNNNPIPFEMAKENLPFSHRYVCTFQAPTPGCYTVTVCDGLISFHVKGSPLTIPVTRNYKMYSAWKKPRTFFNQATKGWGIAYCSLNKRVYMTDRDAHQIIIYHENGTLDKCFGKYGNKPDEMYRPTGVAVDYLNQRLIITDKDNHRLSVFTLDGKFIANFGGKGHKNGEFNYPWGVAVSPKDGTIAVTDSRNHRLQLLDSNGNFLRKYSPYEVNPFEYKTQFNYPRGVTFDKNGENIYITDFNIQTVFKMNLDLTEKSVIIPAGIHLNRPQGVTIDLVGNLLVCDSRSNCIRVISPGGEHISSIVGNPSSFLFPQDVAITSTGEILIVDNNSAVRVL